MWKEFYNMVQDSYGQPNKIKDGVFGAMMDVELINDGPVTIIIESNPQKPSETELPSQSATNEIESNGTTNNNDKNIDKN